MTDEIDTLVLTDGENRVLFHPPETYADGHGFRHRVDLVGGPFRGSIDASSYAGLRALSFFGKELVALHHSLRGVVHLPKSYENLRMSLTGDGLGHIAINVEARALTTVEASIGRSLLMFDFAIDQTHLPAIVATIERWVAAHSGQAR